MTFLASCSLKEALDSVGKLSIPNEEGRKPHKVLLNLVMDGTEGSKVVPQNVYSVTLLKDIEGLTIPHNTKVYREYTLTDYKDSVNCEWTPLVRLPDNYSDMRELYNMQQKYPNLRFIGGNLLNIDGINIGREEETPIVCKGVYDDYEEVKYSELGNIKIVEKKERKAKKEKGKKEKKDKQGSKTTKSSKVKESFNSLFGGSEVVF